MIFNPELIAHCVTTLVRVPYARSNLYLIWHTIVQPAKIIRSILVNRIDLSV